MSADEMAAVTGACNAPGHILVLARDGSLRACDHGGCALTTSASWLDAWKSRAFEDLRGELRAARLPTPYCSGCALWVDEAMPDKAPMSRDYGALPPAEPGALPTSIVLNLAPREALSATACEQLAQLLPNLTKLVVDRETELSMPLDGSWIEILRAAGHKPPLTLRLRRIGDVDVTAEALAGVPCEVIEATLEGSADDGVTALRQLAGRLGATCKVRFVLTPQNWFWFDDVARACIAENVELDLQLQDRNGTIPLRALSVEQLDLVRTSVGAHAEPALQHVTPPLLDALRGLLQRVIRDALQSSDAELPETSLRLPSPDHPWCQAADSNVWWVEQLFSHSHQPLVRDWILASIEASSSKRYLEQLPWLRVLSQKLVWGTRPTAAIAALQQLYRSPKARARLLAEDAEFAARFDTTPFGGPWTGTLGLEAPDRDRPFPIGRAKKPGAVAASVTVLIPSYRHGKYIKETIRSVLAQRTTALKVVVVDDGSPDDTVELARSIDDPRLEVRRNAKNLGLGNSVLQALETIDTPYVALLNSDDLFHPERLTRCLAVLDENPQVQVVTTGLALIDGRGGHLIPDNVSLVLDGLQIYNWVHWFEDVTPPTDLAPEALFETLLECNFLATSSNLTTRTDWLRTKTKALRNLKYCLDWQIFLEGALERSLHHIPQPLAGYRLHATNTVWFEEGSRWAFFLEVNRVIAEALSHYVAGQDELDEDLVFRVTSAVANHVTRNAEADGVAMFLNTAMDALTIDNLAADSPRIQEILIKLGRASAEALAHRRATETSHGSAALFESRRRLLTSLRREQLAREKQALVQREHELVRRIERLDADASRADKQREALSSRIENEKAARQSVRENLDKVRDQLTATARVRKALAAERDSLKHEIAVASARAGQLETDLTAAQKAFEEKSAQVQNKEDAIKRLEKRQAGLIGQGATLRTEIATLRSSREFRIGNFLWNKLPLSYMSRRGKKWFNRLTNAKDRMSLWVGRKFRKQTVEGVAVVASVWQWPIYSHTFVYQEMIGFTHMGLDVKMFHWAMNDADQLQPAFSYLADHRLQMKPAMPQHRTDKQYFDKCKPGRLLALLEKISEATGKPVAELEEEPHVLRACTFARMAEAAGANYLHSYFFYDQSFMVLVTAWLLELPRGVSCYADHMLDDYAFKLVPLQLELADVVVATSARIKRELVEIGGEGCAEKIIVKPNGVDGARFPMIDRGSRNQTDPFEVISISRLEAKKGLEYLIEAVAELKKRGRKILVHIVGAVDSSLEASIAYGEELEQMIEDLELEHEVILHGMMMQDKIQPLMQRSRAFVAPYVELESGDKDGIPTAMLEALASSLPIVTTDAGSILEVVENDVQALVVPQRDSAAYADALDRLIGDPALERQLSKAARLQFDREFDIKVTERRLHERVAALMDTADVR